MDPVFGDAEAGAAVGRAGREIDVGHDADNGGLGLGAFIRGGVGFLQGLEFVIGGIALRQVAIDEEVVGELGGIDGGRR